MDLKLNINGDGSDADDAFKDVADSADKAAKSIEKSLGDASKKSSEAMSKAWEDAEASEARMAAQLVKVQTAFLAVGAAAVKFGIDSVKAFAEADRVQRQLERAAGSLSEAFTQQADALEAQLRVDGELIKQQQTLLLQWGAAPEAIEGAVRAVNDYAAATGKDALTATMDLIKGVETGGEKLANLGVDFVTTGDKAKDLAAITAGLTAKFGGAAAANAASLEGGLNAVFIAMGNVKESFGGLIASIESKAGILDKLGQGLQGIARFVGAQTGFGGMVAALNPTNLAIAAYGGIAGSGPAAPTITGDGKGLPAAASFSLFGPNGPPKHGEGGKGGGAGHHAAVEAAKEQARLLEEIQKADAKRNDDWRKAEIDAQEEYAKQWVEIEKKRIADDKKAQEDVDKWLEDMALERKKREREQSEKSAKDEERALQDSTKDMLERMRKKERDAAAAADAIGAAFVGALAEQLSKLAEGGEFDAALFVSEILASVVGVAGGIIGTALGSPAVGAAIGNLAAMGIRAGGSAMSAAAKKERTTKTFHAGGWVGDEAELPRYHSGAWIGADEQMAILQHGERVLSRREVAGMGGPAGVDSAARGGPSMVVHVTALDAKSAADGFVGGVARGMRDALNRGQGPLPQLLGVGPR